jgi:hypothetical protein
LNQRNIPLVILDACQTAMQGKREFASVASKLIEAGVGSVLAMNYSVLVPTTRKFSAAFYRALAQGQTISVATEHARRTLLDDTFRFKLHRGDKDERVNLYDWFLPALCQQAQDPALFATTGCRLPTTRRRAASAVSGQPSAVPVQPARGGFPDAPPHGFHGRARTPRTRTIDVAQTGRARTRQPCASRRRFARLGRSGQDRARERSGALVRSHALVRASGLRLVRARRRTGTRARRNRQRAHRR